MDIWVPLKEREKKNEKQNERKERQKGDRTVKGEFLFSLLFYFLLSSQIHENLIVGFRRVKNEKCSTRRGLHVGTTNTEFHREFR